MRGKTFKPFVAFICACIIPAYHGRQWSSVTPLQTNKRHLRSLERGLDESDCASLLRPHIQKVSLVCPSDARRMGYIGGSHSKARMLCEQVALMFLVRGNIYHEDVWTAWIGDLVNLVPPSLFCDEALAQCYREMPERQTAAKSVYDLQVYFSIAVHTKPDFPGYKGGSIFDGRIVHGRVEVRRVVI